VGQLPAFGGSPAPVAPRPFAQPVTPAPQFGGNPSPAFSQSSEEKPKRHRRTKAEMEADAARARGVIHQHAPNESASMQQSPGAFASALKNLPAQQFSPPTPQFGLVPSENAPRPDAALASAINDVLGLPTEE